MNIFQSLKALRAHPTSLTSFLTTRLASSDASSSRWKSRQSTDPFARAAKEQNFRSRAAFKLLELHKRNGLFRRGQTVVDLGYAPGSWSQVAVELTGQDGVVVGVDLLPAAPPEGMVAVQGDFLEEGVRERVKRAVAERKREVWAKGFQRREAERRAKAEQAGEEFVERSDEGHVFVNSNVFVDLVMSDMLMNTCGVPFRDHVLSMELCNAAVDFAEQNLRVGGHFICKYYQGAEDKVLETRLKSLFKNVYRGKPDSSRKESKESYFVCKRRMKNRPTDLDHEPPPIEVKLD